jgi:hypothetical protein
VIILASSLSKLFTYFRAWDEIATLKAIKKLAEHLDRMRLGLVKSNERNEKGQKKAICVIEDMNKSTAEVFSRLQLGKYIPA